MWLPGYLVLEMPRMSLYPECDRVCSVLAAAGFDVVIDESPDASTFGFTDDEVQACANFLKRKLSRGHRLEDTLLEDASAAGFSRGLCFAVLELLKDQNEWILRAKEDFSDRWMWSLRTRGGNMNRGLVRIGSYGSYQSPIGTIMTHVVAQWDLTKLQERLIRAAGEGQRRRKRRRARHRKTVKGQV